MSIIIKMLSNVYYKQNFMIDNKSFWHYVGQGSTMLVKEESKGFV